MTKVLQIVFFAILTQSCTKPVISKFSKFSKLETPARDYSIYLKDGQFEMLETKFVSYDQIVTQDINSGKYKIEENKIVMTDKMDNSKFVFEIVNDEEIKPIKTSNPKLIENFYAIKTFHDNKMPKVIGSRDSLGRKNALWLYFNVKGKVVNQRLYKNGKLIKDNYKSDIKIP